MAVTAFDGVDTSFDDASIPFDGKEKDVEVPDVAALIDPGTMARRKRKHDVEAFVAWWRLRRLESK